MEKPLLYPIRKFGASAAVLILSAGLLYWHLSVGVYLERGFVWDEPIMLALYNLRQPWLDSLFVAVTQTADLWVVIPVLAMFIYLWRRSEKITALIVVVSAITFPIISLVLKSQFGRPRQDIIPPLVVEHSASFPSGHTLTAVAVYGLISVLLWQRGHRLLSILSGIWVCFIALSRVYLGAHYPSDVLASLALGTILLIIVIFIDNRLNSYMRDKKNGA